MHSFITNYTYNDAVHIFIYYMHILYDCCSSLPLFSLSLHLCIALPIYIYSQCQNYRTEPGGQKYGKIPYLCPPPGSDSERSREI